MITLTAIEESITQTLIENEGSSAGALARIGQHPPWRVYATLQQLQRKGIVAEDVHNKNKPQDPGYWYVHPQYREALGLAPLVNMSVTLAIEIERGDFEERRRSFGVLLAEQKRAKAAIKFEAVPCKHCGQKHCLPKRGRRRKLAPI